MNGSSIIETIYGPIFLTALIAALGWVFRQVYIGRIESRRRLDTMNVNLQTMTTAIQTIRDTHTEMKINQDRLMREFPQLKETVAVLASEFERHEQWHERHN